ncbi:MAG TPA: leucyl aminopeptidase [bacterium]|nr:leucyl aminopeptidase [bacterium]
MNLKAVVQDVTEYKCDVLIVNLFEGVKKPGGATGAVDRALGGAIKKMIASGEFKGKRGETAEVPTGGAIGANRLIIAGLGKKEKFGDDVVRLATSSAVNRAGKMKAERIATLLHGAGAGGLGADVAARAIAEGAILGAYKFDKYVGGTGKSKDRAVKELAVVINDAGMKADVGRGLKLGRIMAEGANFARDLVNEPPNVLNPQELAKRARAMCRNRNLSIRVHNRAEIEKMKMGAFLGVNKGSALPPVFIEISYRGNPSSKKNMAIIGKGITFDSGGLSLKPASSMSDMKSDMSGAAAVLGAMDIIEKLKPKINVTMLIPATENMPDGRAQRVGDIVTAMNGRTIEVLNTDAEGRLVLCDAICYAAKKKMSPIVDIATLTGACIVALGYTRTGLFGNDEELIKSIEAAGEKCGERMWHMPTDDDYKELLETKIADIKNVGGRWGGAITAALFLEFFTDETSWAHLDIAGPAYLEKKDRYFGAGATGCGARTIAQMVVGAAPR